MNPFQATDETPKFFNLLSDSDKQKYFLLQRKIRQKTEKRHRGYRFDIFLDCIEKIRNFAQRGDKDDWKRCCVCGLCFLKCGVAVNSRQLKYLINKCKSSINGALKKMKYETISARGDINPELVDFLPILKGNIPELRQWSVRAPTDYKPTTLEKSKVDNITYSENKDKSMLIDKNTLKSLENFDITENDVFENLSECEVHLPCINSIDDFEIFTCSYPDQNEQFVDNSLNSIMQINNYSNENSDFTFLDDPYTYF